jgi:phosphoribosylamine--glycine ligase
MSELAAPGRQASPGMSESAAPTRQASAEMSESAAPTRRASAGTSASPAPTRILLVGSGGREHALAWRLAHEPGVRLVVVAPGSDAIADEPGVRCAPGIDPLDGPALVAIARREEIELVVIGPEAPLAAGVADELVAAGIPTFGPTRAAARIESSKAFCHEVAAAAGVRMARASAFDDATPARASASALAAAGDGVVIKADGLAAGKGVTVCDTLDEAESALHAIFAEGVAGAGPRVVIEERLRGREASLIALCDGRDALALPAARDHKRLRDGDTGPNTGGMGAFSPVSDLPDEMAASLVERIHRPILAELARRGTPFRGALYAGLILTADGPALLECNARFGDPETQAVLPRLGVPLGPLLLAAAEGWLAEARRRQGLEAPLLPVIDSSSVAIVAAAAGYPEAPRSGDPITGLEAAVEAGALVFHAGTGRGPDGTMRTKGGRVLTVVGLGPHLGAARDAAEGAIQRIRFAGMQRRRDIALESIEAIAAIEADGATGPASRTDGADTTTSGPVSRTDGADTTTSGPASRTDGADTTTSGPVSRTDGADTTTSGPVSRPDGADTTTSGSPSSEVLVR